MTKKRGRPTKYGKALQRYADNLVDKFNCYDLVFESNRDINLTVKQRSIILNQALAMFYDLYKVEQICDHLNITRETFYNWQKKYPEFSDTIKEWEVKRNATLAQLGRAFMFQKNGTANWIFLMKNCTEFRDNPEESRETNSGTLDKWLDKLKESIIRDDP